MCAGHIIVAVNPLPLSANPAPRNVSLSAAILAGRQVTSRAEEDPGIADSDGDVVVGNDGREEEGGWIRRDAARVVISTSFERERKRKGGGLRMRF